MKYFKASTTIESQTVNRSMNEREKNHDFCAQYTNKREKEEEDLSTSYQFRSEKQNSITRTIHLIKRKINRIMYCWLTTDCTKKTENEMYNMHNQ